MYGIDNMGPHRLRLSYDSILEQNQVEKRVLKPLNPKKRNLIITGSNCRTAWLAKQAALSEFAEKTFVK